MTAVLTKRDEFLTFVSDISVVVSDQLAAVEHSRVEEPPVVRQVSGIQRLLLDHEKVVWHWPDIGSRLTEDVR